MMRRPAIRTKRWKGGEGGKYSKKRGGQRYVSRGGSDLVCSGTEEVCWCMGENDRR